MDISVLPILSLIIFSPIVGIALAAIFRDEGNGIPAKVSALFSSGISFLLSLHLWFNFRLANGRAHTMDYSIQH